MPRSRRVPPPWTASAGLRVLRGRAAEASNKRGALGAPNSCRLGPLYHWSSKRKRTIAPSVLHGYDDYAPTINMALGLPELLQRRSVLLNANPSVRVQLDSLIAGTAKSRHRTVDLPFN
jgi:hypothetical protein